MKKFKILTSVIIVLVTLNSFSQQLAFPGAEGFGKYTSGGRAGKVYAVTNLNDSGEGSLRAAVEASGPRIVVFQVSGIIALNSVLSINNGDITIAGQTAPGDGICIKNYSVAIDADNVIIRYLRCRLGDEKDQEDDALRGRNHKDIIIDHCSVSWSVDETASFYDNQYFTMQWCILSESLYHSVHEKGNHGYGGIWGGQGVTFHHNLLAHHTSRNPRFCGSRYSNDASNEFIDHRNNVIFNWGGNSCYGAEGGSYNIVNNYYKYGPATGSGVRDRIINPNADAGSNTQEAGVWGKFYVDGNYVWKYPATTENNWTGVDGVTSTIVANIKLTSPVDYSIFSLNTQSAEEAFEYVLVNAGSTLPKRDTVDTRIINETRTGKVTYGASNGVGTGIIDTPSDVGGWPVYNSGDSPVDIDGDGIPDEWEDLNSLDKNDASDGAVISSNGYTNLENYLNSLVAEFKFLVRPIHFVSDSVSGNSVYLSWDDISDNETGFIIERKTVDGEWTLVETTAGDVTSFCDESLTSFGDYYYRIKAINAYLESFYTDSIVVNVIEEETNSTTQVNNSTIRCSIYPNPVVSDLNISLQLTKDSPLSVKVLDVKGSMITTLVDELKGTGDYTFTFNTSLLTKGVYMVQIQTDNQGQLFKFIK